MCVGICTCVCVYVCMFVCVSLCGYVVCGCACVHVCMRAMCVVCAFVCNTINPSLLLSSHFLSSTIHHSPQHTTLSTTHHTLHNTPHSPQHTTLSTTQHTLHKSPLFPTPTLFTTHHNCLHNTPHSLHHTTLFTSHYTPLEFDSSLSELKSRMVEVLSQGKRLKESCSAKDSPLISNKLDKLNSALSSLCLEALAGSMNWRRACYGADL